MHQQVTNSISRLLTAIRTKNCVFDSLFICGNPEFRKEVVAGFKSSDLVSRVNVVRDIPIAVDSPSLNSINQLKQAIPNIHEYIAEDTIFSEKIYVERLQRFLDLEEE